MTSNSDQPTETAKTLADLLSARGMSQYRLAKDSGSSQPYLNQVARGARTPSAGWLNLVADTMGLSDEERARLHRAGAKDNGFEIDL